jgi:hypothetical protein
MIESPLIDELLAERTQDNILEVLRERFGVPPIELTNQLRAVQQDKKLTELLLFAVKCPNLEAFRARLFA